MIVVRGPDDTASVVLGSKDAVDGGEDAVVGVLGRHFG